VIVCPRCHAVPVEDERGLTCPRCAYRAEREDGIVLFNPEILPDHADYRAEGLDDLYRFEQVHFWFRHRLRVIREAFHSHVGRGEEILEVGAGTGHTARALQEDGYRHLALGEIHTNGLHYAKRYGLDRLYQFDVRTPPFVDHFDAVGLFDVLEHIQDDEAVARSLHAMLRAGGRILVTVPALRWLWSRVDELSGHHRRYDRRSLTSLLDRNGFDVLECRYFFIALAPALLLRSLLARRTDTHRLQSDSGLTVSRTSNALLGLASGAGDRLLSPLRFQVGGSLLAVARKR
jgi:SAM-dependent methyltransferase